MKLVKIGEVVNTHGIKGEIRIMSGNRFSNNNFSNKYKTIIIDDKKYKVIKYRFHKKFHQIFLEGYNNINDVLFLKGKSVLVETNDQDIVDNDDLVGLDIIKDGIKIGVVKSISHTKLYKLIVSDSGDMIPIQDHFIKKITKERVEVQNL